MTLGLYIAGAAAINTAWIVTPALLEYWSHHGTVPGMPAIPIGDSPPLSQLLLREATSVLKNNALVVGTVLGSEALKVGLNTMGKKL